MIHNSKLSETVLEELVSIGEQPQDEWLKHPYSLSALVAAIVAIEKENLNSGITVLAATCRVSILKQSREIFVKVPDNKFEAIRKCLIQYLEATKEYRT